MSKHYFKHKILSTSMLIAPAVLMLASAQPALADCSSSGGTVAAPTNGATITCAVAGGDQTTTIGNNTDGVAATVNIEADSTVDVAGGAIQIDDVTVTLGVGATLGTSGDSNHVLYSYDGSNNISQTVTVGDDATISTQGNYAYGIKGYDFSGGNTEQTITLSGNNATISTQGNYAYVIDASSYGDGIVVQTVILSGDNATISAQGNYSYGVRGYTSNDVTQTVTLSGEGANISTLTGGAKASSNGGDVTQTVTLSGDNATISSQNNNYFGVALYSYSGSNTQTITLSGNNATISTQGNNATAIDASSSDGDQIQAITLSGDNANITTFGSNARGISVGSSSGTAQATVTLSANTSIISTQSEAIRVVGGGASNPISTIDSAGLIQGGTNSIRLDDGDDSLTLRTGSNLSSPTGANLGAGTDTLTLVGNGSEDETFLNIETVEVDADATGWTLSGTSSFDDLNINTGLFSNNGNLTIANGLTVDSGIRFGGTGTTIGNVTNNGTLAPGNSVGTQTITGNFVQGSGGTLAIEFDNTGTDRLNISGTATIDGAVTFTEDAAGVVFDTAHIFLDAAGGITGTFSDTPTLVSTSAGVAQAVVDVGANQATLTLSAGTGLAASGTTASENAVSAALDNANSSDNAGVIAIANALNASSNTTNALSSQSVTVVLNAVSSTGVAIGKVTNIVQSRAASAVAGNSTISAASSPADIANIQPAAGGINRHIWAQAVSGVGEVDSDSISRGADYPHTALLPAPIQS